MRAAAWIALGGVTLLTLALPCRGAGDPEQVLTDLVEGHRTLADLSEIRFSSGTPDFRGRSTLWVSGDGALKLEVEAGGRADRRTGRLEHDGVRALLQLLLDTRFWQLEPPSGPLPPDAEQLSIRFATRGGELDVELRFPLREMIESPDCLALVEVFRALESVLLEGPTAR